MLTVENLEKRFVSHFLDGKEILGFSQVSFQVAAGRALGLSGPSGYGKSSVLCCPKCARRAAWGRRRPSWLMWPGRSSWRRLAGSWRLSKPNRTGGG